MPLARMAACGLLTATLTTALPALAGRAGATSGPEELIILQWNVENLFDPEDDPRNEGDDAFTPHGWRHWTRELYETKVRHLAGVIAGVAPHMVCLQEVENRAVLDALTAGVAAAGGPNYPFIVHRDSPDHRGIDVAILSRFPPGRKAWFAPVPNQRESLLVDFAPHGHALTLIVNHWKSRWDGEAASAPLRMAQARAVRARVDRMLTSRPDAAILVIGDFNDDYNDTSLARGLRVIPCASSRAGTGIGPGTSLLALHAGLHPDKQGTLYYRKERVWNAFDAMYATRIMGMTPRPSAGWAVKPGSYTVIRDPSLLNEDDTPRAFRRYKDRATNRWTYDEGYSDHLPVRISLQLAQPPQEQESIKNP